MNSGRLLKRPRATLCSLVLILTFAGCTVGRLSDRILIDRMTQVTDAVGQPIALASKNDFLHVLEVGEESERGMKLGAGTVLTYVRWSPGFATLDKVAGFGLKHEPASESYRIVLRKVDEDKGELRDDEERFLASVLTVHRLKWDFPQQFGATFIAQLRPVLYRFRKLLWNALVADLAVRRVGPGPSDGLDLLPTFKIEDLCTALKVHADHLPEGDGKASAVAEITSFAKAFVPGGEGNCAPGKGRVLELTAMPMGTLKSVIHGAASTDFSDDSDNFYFSQGSKNPYARFNFATAELNGARVDRREVPEADWTLREWEDSDICHIVGGGKTVIRRVRLTRGIQPLWISRGGQDPKPTYRLVSILTPKRTGRWIERISQVGQFEDRAVLDESALDILRMSDLEWIDWAIPGKRVDRSKAQAAVQPSGCYFASER
jgi:hypothetical protein